MNPITRQINIQTCRVRFTHHCELKAHGLLLQMITFWCAERTLQSPLQIMSRIEINIISMTTFIANRPVETKDTSRLRKPIANVALGNDLRISFGCHHG